MNTFHTILRTFLFLLLVSTLSFEAFANTEYEDASTSRTIFNPTALPGSPKRTTLNIHNGLLWHLDHSVNSNLDMGIQLPLPAGFFFVGPTARVTGRISKNVHMGLFSNVGFFSMFLYENVNAFYFSGGPIITWGNEKYQVTASSLVIGGHSRGKTGYMILPTLGGSVSLSKAIKFQLEAITFQVPQADSYSELIGIIYGIRLIPRTGKLSADINFIAPISPTYSEVSGIYRTFPLGIPLISLRYRF